MSMIATLRRKDRARQAGGAGRSRGMADERRPMDGWFIPCQDDGNDPRLYTIFAPHSVPTWTAGRDGRAERGGCAEWRLDEKRHSGGSGKTKEWPVMESSREEMPTEIQGGGGDHPTAVRLPYRRGARRRSVLPSPGRGVRAARVQPSTTCWSEWRAMPPRVGWHGSRAGARVDALVHAAKC